jgi:cobaltochelatase CobT
LEGAGSWFGLLLALSPLILIFWLVFRRAASKTPCPAEDGPEDEPYRVFTRAFDMELAATDVSSQLAGASPDSETGWYQRDNSLWRSCIPGFQTLLRDQEGWEEAPERLRGALAGIAPSDVVATLLIDHSGSMKGARIAWAAVVATKVAALLAGLSVRSEILGFSTAGWRGGFAYRQWKEAGRPPRPGRLCGLMHIVYKSADDEALTDEARDVMLNPALLRENVDGEAISWAVDRLTAQPEPHKVLILVSDGAPVDDATLMHNGPSILYRHVKAVLRDIAERGSPIVGGLRISDEFDDLYPIAATVNASADLAPATMDLLERLFAAVPRE